MRRCGWVMSGTTLFHGAGHAPHARLQWRWGARPRPLDATTATSRRRDVVKSGIIVISILERGMMMMMIMMMMIMMKKKKKIRKKIWKKNTKKI